MTPLLPLFWQTSRATDPESRRHAVADYLRTRLFEPVGMKSMLPEFDASGTLVEVELLLVEKRGEGDETDQRRGEERQAPPDALERLDLVGGTPALGKRR